MAREYYLIQKGFNTLFAKYKGNAMRISRELPYSVDEVLVGKLGVNSPYKITTYKDSKGRIIERAFDYPNKPLKNIVYKRYENIINQDEFVESTVKREFVLPRDFVNSYNDFQKNFGLLGLKTCFWNIVRTQTDHFSHNVETGVKILSRTSVDFLNDSQRLIHRFVEFPHLLAKKVKNDVYKMLYFETDNCGKVNPDTIFEDGVKVPKNDSFLGLRAFDIESAKEPLANRFLKDRKIDKTGMTVETEYIPPEDEIKRLSACFIASDGSINYNVLYPIKSKFKLVSTARHEVEHGWQYYLDARNGSDSTTWQRYVYRTFGPIPDKNRILQAEADKCTDAIDNYVTYQEDYKKYKKNYIEVQAEKIARTIRNKYERHGKKLSIEFPHIPKELL